MEIDWSALDAALADESFGSQACLTFYLMGPPHHHLTMRAALRSLGATNLAGEEGGFVYAKVPVRLTRQDISDKISRVREFATQASVEIEIIDLDSTPNIERTKFYTLWKPNAQTH